MKVTFIKIARYSPLASGETNKYQAYTKVTTRKTDPQVDKPISYHQKYQQKQFTHVFSSPLLRAKASAEYLSNNITYLEELSEVRFDLTRLVSLLEYQSQGSNLVRTRFVEGFINDQLLEKRRDLIAQCEGLIARLAQSQLPQEIVVSHSFKMKILEAYLDGHDLVKSPEILGKYIQAESKTYNFGEGFVKDIDL